jgi:hypothetical protein
MCFGHIDDDGPDVWLTIENGRYVPAPPMIYMPGLRQMHDRLPYKAHHTKPSNTSGDDPVRPPMNTMKPILNPQPPAPIPPSPATDSSPIPLTQPLPENLNPNPTSNLATVVVRDTEPAAPKANNESAEAPSHAELPHEEPPEIPSEALSEDVEVKLPETLVPAASDAGNSHDSGTPSISANTPPSPSNSSSSLRSILKNTEASKVKNKNSEGNGEPAGRSKRKDEKKKREKETRPTTKKSVSFVDDTAEPCPPQEIKTLSQGSAAKEGAAIAKRLVEREKALQNGKKVLISFGGGDGNMGRRRSTPYSMHEQGATHTAQETQKYRNQAGSSDGRTDPFGRDDAVTHDSRQRLAGGPTLSKRLHSDDEDISNIDDGILRKWP